MARMFILTASVIGLTLLADSAQAQEAASASAQALQNNKQLTMIAQFAGELLVILSILLIAKLNRGFIRIVFVTGAILSISLTLYCAVFSGTHIGLPPTP